jgi:hypothetical protein
MFIHSIDEPDSSNEIRKVLMPAEFTPPLRGTLCQLEPHCQARLRTTVAFRFAVSWTDGDERAFDRIDHANMTPVLSWEFEERQQHISVFLRTLHRFCVLGFERFYEQVKSLYRRLLPAALPNIVQHCSCLGLDTPEQFVEHVGRLVNRTPLHACSRKDLFQSLPEARFSVADHQSWSVHQTSCFGTVKHFLP